MDQVLIAQLSDTHICAGGKPLGNGVPTSQRLDRAVAWILSGRLPIQGCVITGDLVDEGSEAEYQALRERLGPLHERMPVYLVIGNHDARRPLQQIFSDYPGIGQTSEFIQYSLPIGPTQRLVVLDSLVPNEPGGFLCDRRLEWLDDEIARHKHEYVVLAVHHPVFDSGNAFFDAMRLSNAQALAPILGRHGRVRLVLNGHVHRTIAGQLAGIPAWVGASCAFPYGVDYAKDRKSHPLDEPPGLSIHRLGEPGAPWASHSVLLPLDPR